MKVLKAIRILGDVAEIIVASSIVVELIERYRAKRKSKLFFCLLKKFPFPYI